MEERTLEIREIFELLKKRMWVLIGITFLTTLLGAYYALQKDVMYRARVQVYVGDSANVINSYTETQMDYYSNFMNAFKEIIVIDDFLNETLQKNQIKLKANKVRDGLSFNSSNNSPILEINYTSNNKKQSRDVLKALADEYATQAKRIIPNTNVQVIDDVKIFTIERETTKMMVVGLTVGVVISISIILVWDYFDDTIRKKQTLEKLLPIPVLGTLPHVDEKGEK